MTSKDAFAQKLQSQIDEWQVQVADYQQAVQQHSGNLQATHEKNLEAVKMALKQAMEIHAQVCAANEDVWKQMQTSAEKNIHQLANGWLDVMTSFQVGKYTRRKRS
ncbi:MAG: hypothetical protein ABJN26_17425 [Stappiaceae bacterium]